VCCKLWLIQKVIVSWTFVILLIQLFLLECSHWNLVQLLGLENMWALFLQFFLYGNKVIYLHFRWFINHDYYMYCFMYISIQCSTNEFCTMVYYWMPFWNWNSFFRKASSCHVAHKNIKCWIFLIMHYEFLCLHKYF